MKLSKETLAILDNFSKINPSLFFREGSLVKTESTSRTCVAFASVAEPFPQEFGIFDLRKFLQTYNFMDEPEISFTDTQMILEGDRSQINYGLCKENMIKAVPEPGIMDIPDSYLCSGVIGIKELTAVDKAATVLAKDHIIFEGTEDGEFKILVADPKKPSADSFSITLDAEVVNEGRWVISREEFNLMKNSYEIKVFPKSVVFISNNITYVIGQVAQ